MIPPLNRYSTQQILHALGNSHHWSLIVTAVVVGLVIFGLGAAVAGTITRSAVEVAESANQNAA